LRIVGVTAIKEVRIFTTSGALVAKHRRTTQPDVSGLPIGLYIAEIETVNGQTHRRRFIKE